jgi:hypothetical protein
VSAADPIFPLARPYSHWPDPLGVGGRDRLEWAGSLQENAGDDMSRQEDGWRRHRRRWEKAGVGKDRQESLSSSTLLFIIDIPSSSQSLHRNCFNHSIVVPVITS